MCDLHCEQHSSARDNRTFSKGGGGGDQWEGVPSPPTTTYASGYILECKDTTYNTPVIFNTLMNADNLIIKLYLVKEKNTLNIELVN